MNDEAVRAAEDAVWAVAKERAGAGGFEALGPVEVTRIAVAAARPVWVKQAERAMFGDTDDGMVEDDAQLPVGELRRLLHTIDGEVDR